ncbi:hypothetical protein CKM354_000005600 [Cercospora kikuchii]|uniref:EthD domain-containing protein n=1 Tax=Cercospora kikuchii TaxID=84275 RepID=A0A9P3F6W0_9PEZI|nr:uncharacterized protein CKM354_000005600 [Cercospora kikuchii]GIZ36586.1 hypothetical protein CKM354_000005600 [Cercospora kikuchii]
MAPTSITVLYPQGIQFDMDYYKSTHMPLAQEKWEKFGMKSWKVLKVKEGSPYIVQTILEFGSAEEWAAAAESQEGKDVLGDIKNYTNAEPILLVGEMNFSS